MSTFTVQRTQHTALSDSLRARLAARSTEAPLGRIVAARRPDSVTVENETQAGSATAAAADPLLATAIEALRDSQRQSHELQRQLSQYSQDRRLLQQHLAQLTLSQSSLQQSTANGITIHTHPQPPLHTAPPAGHGSHGHDHTSDAQSGRSRSRSGSRHDHHHQHSAEYHQQHMQREKKRQDAQLELDRVIKEAATLKAQVRNKAGQAQAPSPLDRYLLYPLPALPPPSSDAAPAAANVVPPSASAIASIRQLLEDVQRQRLEVEQAAATMEAASHPHTIHDTLVYSLRGETSAMAPLLLSQQDLEVDAELDRARIQRAVDAELAAAQARLQLELRGVTVADSDGSLGSPDADATDSLYPRSTQPAPAAAPQRLSPARLQAPPSSPPTTWRPAQEPHYFASEAPLDNLPPFRTTRASRLREEKARHQRAQLAGRPAAAGRDGARKGIIKKPSSFARRGPIASLVRGVGPSEAGSRLKPQQFRPALDPQPLTPPRAGGRHSSPSSTTARSLAFDLASTTNDGAADSGRPYATLADLRPLAPAILSALRRSGQVQPPAGGEVEAFGSGNSERKGMAAGAQPSPSRTPSSPGASPHDQSVGVRAALHSPQVISPSTRSPERITSPTRSPAPPSAASLPASPARASIGVGFPSPRSIPEVHQMDTATSPIQFSPTSPIVVQPLRRQSSLMAAELEQQPWTPQSSRATAPAASPQRASIGTQMTPQTSAAVLPAAAQTSPFVGHDKAASATLPAPLSPVSIPLGSMLSPQRRRSSGAEATGARSRLAEGVDEEDDVEEEDEEDDEASWLHSTMPSPRRQPQQRSAAVATSPTAAPATRTQAVSPIGGPSRRDADAQVSPGLARLEPRFPAVDPAATPLAAGGDTSILEQAQALPAAGAVVEPTLWTPQSSVSSMSSAVLRRARRQAVMSPGEWQVHPDLHSSLSEGELNLRPASAGQNLPRERESGRHRGGKPGQAPHDQALSSRGSISPLSTALGARHQRRQHSQRPSTAETAESTMADSESGSEASTVNYVSSDSDGSPAPRDHRGLQLSPGQLLIYSRPGPVRPAANPWSTPGPRASGLGHRLYSDPSARRKDAAKTRRVAPTEEQQRGARVSGLGDALVSDTDG